MRVDSYFAALAMLSWVLSANADSVQADWHSAKVAEGIEVYTGSVTGSKFLAFKAITTLPFEVDAVLAAITDYSTYPDWYENCKATELIEQGDGASIVRIVVKTPFPMANRDVINQVVVERQVDATIVWLSSLPERVPPVDGLVRMTQASGSWRLEPRRGGTLVTQTYHADPKAKVPPWMVNRFIVDGPFRSLLNLRRLLQN